MTRKRSLSEDERVLWRTIARGIIPLRGRRVEREEGEGSSPPAAAVKARPMQPAPITVQSPSIQPSPSLAPIDRRTKQKLARGTTSIDGRIDLHGMTQTQAHAALARFLRLAQARDAKLVLVITGKGGLGGDGRGVLRRQVPLWLEGAEFRSLVIGFDAAGVGHGGEGALYVRVRRGRHPGRA